MLNYTQYLETQLRSEDMGLFNDNPYGLSNESFTQWLNQQRMYKRFHNSFTHVEDASLPERKWGFFVTTFKRIQKKSFLSSQFPNGFFEAVNDQGQVACLLPEPDKNREEKFRISLYDERGPRYHEVFHTRTEALHSIAGKYHYEPGALDALVGTEDWDRGLCTLGWISDGLTPLEGYQRDKSNPEVNRLFFSVFEQ
ncbi:hypothetical protein [Vibrio penaeicida]|uniref:Uncharacterized protein n=1 Tax=Vibrio penaeicida TaxID=104609 RepID=A0AAV5NKQ3_9VIBR|nr:hypothetical protein [Vibrio penaeicida]RTZ22996.1 hypothetical protein EKN09_10970 [Vibrio penaeicida]GLQ71075.1 hypothetical protein GCM10007932_04350 [Vibrio penaeicida]